MDFVTQILTITADWTREYLSTIVLAFIATSLVVFGNSINIMLKKHLGQLQFILKTSLFIAFYAFGIAFLTAVLAPIGLKYLLSLEDAWLIACILIGFYGLGFIAQKKGLI
ncbi:DUF3392 family protein [Thiosulfativibrio zosterae]|nr:DUF3392 family protein [Thiosulfativibrio zosterae]